MRAWGGESYLGCSLSTVGSCSGCSEILHVTVAGCPPTCVNGGGSVGPGVGLQLVTAAHWERKLRLMDQMVQCYPRSRWHPSGNPSQSPSSMDCNCLMILLPCPNPHLSPHPNSYCCWVERGGSPRLPQGLLRQPSGQLHQPLQSRNPWKSWNPWFPWQTPSLNYNQQEFREEGCNFCSWILARTQGSTPLFL